eukprot:CAMPEP_0185767458 /NCGR_PEP_ID=MMETSP1174-20130828/43694_1 /TAXON_ID=35687 /ORGANISM="Dictyocha speculum, Strain CCMP1381" /LENGTH=615 /DNA_ID=CAMNT_0028451681 /DNA_START=178 /DNA_END=2025 /DNA_ORIENTATION=+
MSLAPEGVTDLGGTVVDVATEPIPGMKMGTSGLRKKVTVFEEGPYLHNFIQSIFDALPEEEKNGGTLLIGGDGRYFNKQALQVIIRIAAANGVDRLWVAKDGVMATPAASATVRERDGGAAFGAIVLTASHNPGGKDGDFGVKYNGADGAPAREEFTDLVYEKTTEISRYRIVEGTPDVDLSGPAVDGFMLQKLFSEVGVDKAISTGVKVGNMTVYVIDPNDDYVDVLKKAFDMRRLRRFIARKDFNMVFDAMHGAGGPAAKRVLVQELKAPEESLLNCEPSEDFGGGHPDPNLVYADELVSLMGLDSSTGSASPAAKDSPYDFGAASDGDADRNMILGRGFFVTPSDSVAVLAAQAKQCIPAFSGGVGGVARSMPTSRALERVALELGIDCFETPTGWKFFGNLMEDGRFNPFICGEESFGTGSCHIREKDSLWAVLAWLSVLAYANPDRSYKAGLPLVGIKEVVEAHWNRFGRHFYSRHDYENVDSNAADKVMQQLRENLQNLDNAGAQGYRVGELVMTGYQEFMYVDPVDDSITANQGIVLNFDESACRAVFRISGTGSEGATIRMYLETYRDVEEDLFEDVGSVLKKVRDAALAASKLQIITGRREPTVIT